jgi:hypothetical protein
MIEVRSAALKCDFGRTHYAAFVELAWDRDLDIIYLIRTLRLKEQTPLQHAEAVRSRPWKAPAFR